MNSTDQMKYEKFLKMKATRHAVQLVHLVKALGCKISETFPFFAEHAMLDSMLFNIRSCWSEM